MGNKQGSLSNHLETASKTGALAFSGKVRKLLKMFYVFLFRSYSVLFLRKCIACYLNTFKNSAPSDSTCQSWGET